MSLQSFLLRRALPAIAAAAVIAVPAAAQAQETTIPLHEPHRNTIAAEFETKSCDQVPDTKGPYEDGWVFVLPDNDRDFVSVTADFEDAEGNVHTYSTVDPTQGGIYPNPGNGTSKAYIITPAGWMLLDASAVVTGPTKQGRFNLTHTCPGELPPGEEESSPPVDTPTTEPGEEEPSSPSTEPTTEPGVDDSTSPDANGKLPTTGAGLTWVIAGGVALVGAGAATLFLMRRRSAAESH